MAWPAKWTRSNLPASRANPRGRSRLETADMGIEASAGDLFLGFGRCISALRSSKRLRSQQSWSRISVVRLGSAVRPC